MKVDSPKLLPLLCVLLNSGAFAQPVPMDPGEYMVSGVTALGSADGEERQKDSRCIKSEDLANPESVFNNRFLAGFKPDATCTLSGVSITASKVTYNAQCKYSNVRVEAAITRTSFSVVRKASNKSGAGPGAESRIEGKRTGACK